LVANPDHNTIEIFDQLGNPVPGIQSPLSAVFDSGNGFAVGDRDCDGRAEILVAHPDRHRINIFKLLPNGTFTEEPPGGIATTFNTGNGFAVGDVDNDGEDEILVAHQNTNGTENIEVFDRDNTLKNIFNGDFNPGNGFAVGHIDRDNQDVTAILSTVRSGFRRDPSTGTYTQQVRLTNTSANAISGPLWLVLDGLTSATPLNSPGFTEIFPPLGSPFFSVEMGANVLRPQESATAVLKFADPTNAGITYTTRVIAGDFPSVKIR